MQHKRGFQNHVYDFFRHVYGTPRHVYGFLEIGDGRGNWGCGSGGKRVVFRLLCNIMYRKGVRSSRTKAKKKDNKQSNRILRQCRQFQLSQRQKEKPLPLRVAAHFMSLVLLELCCLFLKNGSVCPENGGKGRDFF
jgi:hypothetical protein